MNKEGNNKRGGASGANPSRPNSSKPTRGKTERSAAKPTSNPKNKKTTPKIQVVEKVKFNNGKNKKS